MLQYKSKQQTGDSTSIVNINTTNNSSIYFYIDNMNVSNRFFYNNGILTNIIQYNVLYNLTISEVLFFCENITTANIKIYKNDSIFVDFNVNNNNTYVYNVSKYYEKNSKLKIYIESNIGVNYPVIVLKT